MKKSELKNGQIVTSSGYIGIVCLKDGDERSPYKTPFDCIRFFASIEKIKSWACYDGAGLHGYVNDVVPLSNLTEDLIEMYETEPMWEVKEYIVK